MSTMCASVAVEVNPIALLSKRLIISGVRVFVKSTRILSSERMKFPTTTPDVELVCYLTRDAAVED